MRRTQSECPVNRILAGCYPFENRYFPRLFATTAGTGIATSLPSVKTG